MLEHPLAILTGRLLYRQTEVHWREDNQTLIVIVHTDIF